MIDVLASILFHRPLHANDFYGDYSAAMAMLFVIIYFSFFFQPRVIRAWVTLVLGWNTDVSSIIQKLKNEKITTDDKTTI